MIKIYDKFYIMHGESYVAMHEFVPDVYVLTPHRERAIVFKGFDAAISFFSVIGTNNIDKFKIVPVEN